MALDTSTALVVGKVVSVGCIGIFAGQSLFYNAILMPVLRRVPTDAALPVWADSYHVAKNLQVSLVGASLLSGFSVYYKTNDLQFLIPPVLLSAVVPFTFAFIMPVNRQLLGILDGSVKKNYSVEQLFNKWDLLHFGRTVLSISAFVLALYDAYSGKAVIRF